MAQREQATRSITLRLPIDLFDATKRLATDQKQSLNSLIVSQLRSLSSAERSKVLRDAYDLLGSDAESSVDHAFLAQAEVVDKSG